MGDDEEVQLEFQIDCRNQQLGLNNSFLEWFVVDRTIEKRRVMLAADSPPAKLAAEQGVWKQPVVGSQAPRIEPAIVDMATKRKAWEQDQAAKAMTNKRAALSSSYVSFSPRRSNTQAGVLRFTRNGLRARSALPVLIDDTAAHNIIDKALLSNPQTLAAIAVFGRKTVADLPMVLLEFSLDCDTHIGTKMKLREWFRISEVNGSCKVVIRGIFDKHRVDDDNGKAAISEYMQRDKRLGNPTREQIAAIAALATGADDDIAESDNAAARIFSSNGGSYGAKWTPDSRFVSLHPVTHRKIQRDVNRPAHPFPTDNKHAGSKVNQWDSCRRDWLKRAVKQTQLHDEIQQARRQLGKLIDRLPGDARKAERAAVAALHCTPTFIDFETELDNVACCAMEATSQQDADAEADVRRWPSTFTLGSYVEICNATNQPMLNGKRVRLYDKTDSPQVWLIRVLGKNCGIMKCSEKYIKPLPAAQQAISRPSSAVAGFLDAGIDETGQPTGEAPQMIHRQFGAEYSAELTRKIEELKLRYPTVFTKDVSEPCAFEKMSIKLVPNAVLPSKARFYRNTPKMKEEVRRQIQEQLDWGAIRRADTPHCSDVLLVKRPHMPGQFRFVINFQKLNDATVPEQLIMPDPARQAQGLQNLWCPRLVVVFQTAAVGRSISVFDRLRFRRRHVRPECQWAYVTRQVLRSECCKRR